MRSGARSKPGAAMALIAVAVLAHENDGGRNAGPKAIRRFSKEGNRSRGAIETAGS